MRFSGSLLLLFLSLLGLGSCASTAAKSDWDEVADVDLQPFWEALWARDWQRAQELSEQIGWDAAGSIEGERWRQWILLRQGKRGQLLQELRQWQELEPQENPHLAYLEARLLQVPERIEERFYELADRYPQHTWIRLGAASVAQSAGAWDDAGELLSDTPMWPDARDFFLRLKAQQLAHLKQVDAALALLKPEAFDGGNKDLLEVYSDIANDHGMEAAFRRARAEIRLRSMSSEATDRERIDRVMDRILTELRFIPEIQFEAAVAFLDDLSTRYKLPSGWSQLPRYDVAGLAELIQPEKSSGSPADWWAERQRMLLAGYAPLHGIEFLYLQNARRRKLRWPGTKQNVEIVLAQKAYSNKNNLAVGGTVFRGFYLRLDYAEAIANAIESSIVDVQVEEFAQGTESLPWDNDEDLIPEDWDLPLRIRAQRLQRDNANALDLVLVDVAVHESGHFPEILGWLPDGPSIFTLLPRMLWSLLTEGDPTAWLEFRAQARALAATPEVHWALADIVERSRGYRDKYQIAYSKLLRLLLDEAERRELPPLPYWDQLPAETLRELARAVCVQEGIETLPHDKVEKIASVILDLRAELQ